MQKKYVEKNIDELGGFFAPEKEEEERLAYLMKKRSKKEIASGFFWSLAALFLLAVYIRILISVPKGMKSYAVVMVVIFLLAVLFSAYHIWHARRRISIAESGGFESRPVSVRKIRTLDAMEWTKKRVKVTDADDSVYDYEFVLKRKDKENEKSAVRYPVPDGKFGKVCACCTRRKFEYELYETGTD